MGRKVIHPPPSQACYRFRMDFLHKDSFRAITPPPTYQPYYNKPTNTIPPLSGVCTEIKCLSVENRGSEDLASLPQYLKFGRCSLGEEWDPNVYPLHTTGDTLVEGFSDLHSPYP